MRTALHDGARVRLAALHIERDDRGEAHEVGRPDTGVFAEMPAPGVDLIDWLGAGLTLGEVKDRFRAHHGEEPDLADFVATLRELGWVDEIDGAAVAPPEERPLRAWQPLRRLDGARLAWMRSRPALLAWVAIAIAGWTGVPLCTRCTQSPGRRPARPGIGGSVSVFLNFAVLGVVGWTLVLLHEMSHVLAMRALGQDSTLTTMGLIFQCAFFMRTDMYYVLTNRLRLGNLMEEVRQCLADQARRLAGRRPQHDLSGVPARELRFARGYGAFCVLCFVGLSYVAWLLYLPMLLRFVGAAADGVVAGPAHAKFWDATAFLTVTVGYFVVLIAVSVRDVRRRRRASRAALAYA